MRTIVFMFAGRRQNMEIQLPLLRRVLNENPDVELHLWDLAWDPADHSWLATIAGDRITVINDLYDAVTLAADWWSGPALRFMDVFGHYASREYRDCRFVKIDDDTIFVETDRWPQFIKAIDANPKSIISAQTVNNGASVATMPELWRQFEQLGVPLDDVYKSVEFADLSHQFMFDHWRDLLEQPIQLIATRQHLSINLIGFGWALNKRMARAIRMRGDETVVNEMPRLILQGFLACHLAFGPQFSQMAPEHLTSLRQRYSDIGWKYLLESRKVKTAPAVLPTP